VFVVVSTLVLVGGALGEAALGNYYKDVVREQHELINEMNQNFTELEKASEKLIDLGFYVGKHTLPPKTVKITKTVAVKVPVPFPVKVPEPVPVPVPVSRPVPVPVPTLVAIPVESTAATVATASTVPALTTAGPSPSPTSGPADADPASSQAHESTVQLHEDWKNTSTTITTASAPLASSIVRSSRSISNFTAPSQRRWDRVRTRNTTTGADTGGPDSTMSVVLKFKPVRIRLQSSDLSLMRSSRRPSRMTSALTLANSTRPRSPVPRIRPIPLRQATPEANLHRLRRRPSVKATASPRLITSTGSSSSSSEDSTEDSRLTNTIEESESEEQSPDDYPEDLAPEDTAEEQTSEEVQESAEEEEEEETEEEREVTPRPVRTRTQSSSKGKVRHYRRPRYRSSKPAKEKRHSRPGSKRDSKPDSKRHTKRDSKRDSKPDSRRNKTPKKAQHTTKKPKSKAKSTTTSRPAHSKSYAKRTNGTKSPISITSTTSTTTSTTTTTTTTTPRPVTRVSRVRPELAEAVPAASYQKATIAQLLPSRTDLLVEPDLYQPLVPPPPPPALPPTITRYRGNGPFTRRYPPRATIIRIHIQRTFRGKHIKIFVIKPTTTTTTTAVPLVAAAAAAAVVPNDAAARGPSYQLRQQYGEHQESSAGGGAAATVHHADGGYHTFTQHHHHHGQHDHFGQKHKAGYGGTVKPTAYSVPSDAHLFPAYNKNYHHHHHYRSGNDHTSGKFHYHFHNVHPVGGGGGDGSSGSNEQHQSAASEHQYAIVDGEHGHGPDGSLVTSYDPPASGSTYHFHDDGTTGDDMFAGASTVLEHRRAPHGHSQ
uniref:Uncharacterized protein n=1 Tax=Anopheles epiroticus TaxID=199890 RepID=A0A182P894_9DIPT